MSPLSITVIGSGWLGLPLARHLSDQGHRVAATTRNSSRLAEIIADGIAGYQMEVDRSIDSADAPWLFGADVVVVTIPPSGAGDYAAAARAIAAAAAAFGTRHLLFTSSTSVYPGLCRVVTEEDAGASGAGDLKRNGPAVLAAEGEFAASGVPVTVLRLAGLVGYGRHPARYMSGRRNIPAGDAPVNLVHRDDVIAAIGAVLAAGPGAGGPYNIVASGHPARRDVYTAMCARLSLPLPEFLPGRGDDWKEVSGALFEEALGFSYAHPDPLAPAP
jgi:nucleoside-diphosphate-sugar epimerase